MKKENLVWMGVGILLTTGIGVILATTQISSSNIWTTTASQGSQVDETAFNSLITKINNLDQYYEAPGNDSNTKMYLSFEGGRGDTAVGNSTSHTASVHGETAVAVSNAAGSNTRYATFDGVNDNLSFANSSDFHFGTNNFTIDFWFRINGNSSTYMHEFLSHRQTSGSEIGKFRLFYGDKAYMGGNAEMIGISMHDGSSTSIDLQWDANGKINYNQWHHLALVREGSSGTSSNDFKLYIDGVQLTTIKYSAGNSSLSFPEFSAREWLIGRHDYTTDYHYLKGYLDEFRISNIARWTSNFSPPSVPYKTE